MATCKDCVHYVICQNKAFEEARLSGKAETVIVTIKDRIACKFFKNKADFVEVKHGEWIVDEELKTPLSKAYIRKEKTYHCPYCKKRFRQRMKFCGECGADMRKEDEKKRK